MILQRYTAGESAVYPGDLFSLEYSLVADFCSFLRPASRPNQCRVADSGLQVYRHRNRRDSELGGRKIGHNEKSRF